MQITTDLSIKKITAPEQGRKIVRVKGASGLYLYISQRNRMWYLRARPAGEKNPVPIKLGVYGRGEQGLTLKEAKAKADDMRSDIASGIDPREEARRQSDSTFAAAGDRFLKLGRTAKGETWSDNTRKQYHQVLKSDRLKHWQALPVANISETMVSRYIDILERESKHTLAKRHLSCLKRFFKWCHSKKQGYIPRTQLLPTGVELEQAVERVRDRYLPAEEITIFWKATELLAYPWQQYYRLALLTGQRVGNVQRIERSDIRDAIWQQDKNKSKRPMLVPLNGLALEVIESCSNTSEWLLTTTGDVPIVHSDKVHKALKAHIADIIEKNKLKGVFEEHWTPHDLRRTIIWHLREARTSRDICEAILNHAPQGVTAKHYDHHNLLDEKTEALDLWGGIVSELIGRNPDNVVRLQKGARNG